ncbi:MAG: DUF5677 domain-containing protein, partial [candidate division Zixibacteria bacterium]|nr:DUF5677 domain-containing protein [candidate division Zixibacteria bacterium]
MKLVFLGKIVDWIRKLLRGSLKMTFDKISLKHLDFQEQEVAKQTKENFPAYFDDATEGMNLYLDFIGDLMSKINNSNQQIEHYAFWQLYRNLYTMKAIYNLINTGHYFDVMILLRSVFESNITVFFLHKNPEHLNMAIRDYKQFGWKFSMSNRLTGLNQRVHDAYFVDYQNLCRFTHPNVLNITAMFSSNSEMNSYPYGVLYSEKDALLTIYLFTRYLGMTLDCAQFVFQGIIKAT